MLSGSCERRWSEFRREIRRGQDRSCDQSLIARAMRRVAVLCTLVQPVMAGAHPLPRAAPEAEPLEHAEPNRSGLVPILPGNAVRLQCAELLHVWCEGAWISSEPVRLYHLSGADPLPPVGMLLRCWHERDRHGSHPVAVAGTRVLRIEAFPWQGVPLSGLPPGAIRVGFAEVAEWIPGQCFASAVGMPLVAPPTGIPGLYRRWRRLPPLCARVERPSASAEYSVFGPIRPPPATVRVRLGLADFALAIEVGESAGLPASTVTAGTPPVWLTYHDRFAGRTQAGARRGWRWRDDIALRPSSIRWPAAARRFLIEGLGPYHPPLLDTELLRRGDEILVPCRSGTVPFHLGSLTEPGAWKARWPEAPPALSFQAAGEQLAIEREGMPWIDSGNIAVAGAQAEGWLEVNHDRLGVSRSFLGRQQSCRIGPVAAVADITGTGPAEVRVGSDPPNCRIWLAHLDAHGRMGARRRLLPSSHESIVAGPGIEGSRPELWVEWRPACRGAGDVLSTGLESAKSEGLRSDPYP